jgi:hypothetical protein
MNKFNWLEIFEIFIKIVGVIIFIPAVYFILIVMIELQNSLVGSVV